MEDSAFDFPDDSSDFMPVAVVPVVSSYRALTKFGASTNTKAQKKKAPAKAATTKTTKAAATKPKATTMKASAQREVFSLR